MSGSDESTPGPSLMRELAHELRDALSPLASSVDLARLRHFDAEASRLLAEKVDRGLRRALAILETFIIAEQAERATLPLQLQAVPLEEILQGARAALGGTGRFTFPSEDAAATVRADVGHSTRVLTAVLQHAAAIAWGDGRLEVRTTRAAAHAQIRVRGSIDPDNRPREEWFASYRGGDGRMALRTGLQIMKLQGGALELVREDAGGFELVLQFARAAQPQAARASAPSSVVPEPPRSAERRAPGARVLIVDDSPEVRRAYSEALRELGYTVLEAVDAEQALALLESTRPDVALIDIHLPRMNGYRLARAIRAREHGDSIFLVMLSGMALDAVTRELAQEAGFDDSLDKMAGSIALRELIEAGRARRAGG
jgi:CheY-like chemotaxis protein